MIYPLTTWVVTTHLHLVAKVGRKVAALICKSIFVIDLAAKDQIKFTDMKKIFNELRKIYGLTLFFFQTFGNMFIGVVQNDLRKHLNLVAATNGWRRRNEAIARYNCQ